MEEWQLNRASSLSEVAHSGWRLQASNSHVDALPVCNLAGKQKQDAKGRGQQPWLPEAPVVEKPRAVHNAAALAYMGDAVYEVIHPFFYEIHYHLAIRTSSFDRMEFKLLQWTSKTLKFVFPCTKGMQLYVRRHFLTPPQTMDKFNQRVMALVCCEAQVTSLTPN